MTSDPGRSPYGDGRPAAAQSGLRPTWNRRAVALAVATVVVTVGAAAAVAACVLVVVSAPDGGGVDFRFLPLSGAAVLLFTAVVFLAVATRTARRA